MARKAESKAITQSGDALPVSWLEGASGQHFDKEDMQLPFIRIVQKQTPQADDQMPEFNPEFKVGMIYDTVTQRLWDGQDGLAIIPVQYRRSLTEWQPRNKGGGFVADHSENRVPVLNQANRVELPDGRSVLKYGDNELTEASEYYSIALPIGEDPFQCLIVMAGFGRKAARMWNTLMQMKHYKDPEGNRIMNPACHLGIWKLTTRPDSNALGNFMRWDTPKFLMNSYDHDDADYLMALITSMHEGLQSGTTKANYAEAEPEV